MRLYSVEWSEAVPPPRGTASGSRWAQCTYLGFSVPLFGTLVQLGWMDGPCACRARLCTPR